MIVFTNWGGLTSSFLFKDNEAPRFTRGIATNLSISALGVLVVIVIELYILDQRRKRATGKCDNRVLDLYRETTWSNEQMREYLYVFSDEVVTNNQRR